MIWSDDVAVFWVGADGCQRSFVDDTFDLHDHRIKDVDVERLAAKDDLEVLLKQADDAFPTSAVMTGVRRMNSHSNPLFRSSGST